MVILCVVWVCAKCPPDIFLAQKALPDTEGGRESGGIAKRRDAPFVVFWVTVFAHELGKAPLMLESLEDVLQVAVCVYEFGGFQVVCGSGG